MTHPLRATPVAFQLLMLSMAVISASVDLAAQTTLPTKHSGEKDQRFQTISQTISNEIPLVIAHRGASGYLPEHTQESTAFAHALNADYIEQDVVMTKDGVAVVMHDVTLNSITDVADVFPGRDTDGKFYVFDFTYAELQRLTVHERESAHRFPSQKGQFRIGTLEQHIQLIQGLNTSRARNTGLYVEIKKPGLHRSKGLDPSVEVLEILKRYSYVDADDRVFLQCFETNEVERIRTELNCRLPIIQLFSATPTVKQLMATAKMADGIGVKISAIVSGIEGDLPVLSDLVKQAHENNLMVHAWTLRNDSLPNFIDTPEQLIDALVKDAGVDGIFTDHPDTVFLWRKKMTEQGKLKGPFHLLNNGTK